MYQLEMSLKGSLWRWSNSIWHHYGLKTSRWKQGKEDLSTIKLFQCHVKPGGHRFCFVIRQVHDSWRLRCADAVVIVHFICEKIGNQTTYNDWIN